VEKCALELLQLPSDGQKEHLSDHFMNVIELKRQTSTAHPFLDYALDGVITHAQQAHCAGHSQDSHIRIFPLDTWIRLHNMLVASQNLRLSHEATLAYILVTKGASQLVELITENSSWRPDTGNLAFNEQHRTLLGAATDRGDYAMLDKFLALGVPPSSDAKDGQSCLSLAIGKGDAAICRRLMAAGAEVTNTSTRYGSSDLRLAIESGCLEIVQALVRHPRYARHLNSSFEADLKYSIRRYTESACSYKDLSPMLDEALRRSGESDPGTQSSKGGMQAIHTTVLLAACKRTDIPVIHRTIDEGAIVDDDVLTTSLVAGDLDVIDLLLGLRADIEPSTPDRTSNSGRRDTKFIQLLLDEDENAFDIIVTEAYPHFCIAPHLGMSITVLPWPSPTTTPEPTSLHANSRDTRFVKALSMAVYHGDSWVSVLERLLDKTIHVSSREGYIDIALQRACYFRHTVILQALLDWCRVSALKYKPLKGLARGLIFLAGHAYLDMVQHILDSQLDLPVDLFCEAYSVASDRRSRYYEDHQIRQILLEWALKRSRRNVGFANGLGFVPTGDNDDQHRLEEHLQSKRSLQLRAASGRGMINPENM
jgi:hypothetical protein